MVFSDDALIAQKAARMDAKVASDHVSANRVDT
jgi:hypothetical protein